MKNRLFIFGILLVLFVSARALTVEGLKVNGLKNPSGIDDIPTFGWLLSDTAHNVSQRQYEISIYESSACEKEWWNSGIVTSNESQWVKPTGLSLQPETRYYWRVAVVDNFGNKVSSVETAYFDTGVMGDWSGAKWIREGDYIEGLFRNANVSTYAIEMDVEIEQLAAGICFARKDDKNFYMWQLRVNADSTSELKEYQWSSGVKKLIKTVKLDPKAPITRGKPFHIKMDITNKGGKCMTYIDGVLVDEQNGYYPHSAIGFTQNSDGGVAETAYFDNIKVTETPRGYIWLNEDFSHGNVFNAGEIVDGRLKVVGVNPNLTFWQPSGRASQSVEADIIVNNGALLIYFGATTAQNAFIWEISTSEGEYPIIRRYDANWSNPIKQGEDVVIRSIRNADFVGKEHHVRILADGGVNTTVYTYIDACLIDEYVCTNRRVPLKKCGFKTTGTVYVDNVRLSHIYPDGDSCVVFTDDFECGESLHFNNVKVEKVSNEWKMAASGDVSLCLEFETLIFNTGFVLDKPVKSAKIYTSALGVYDMWLNGTRIGHPEANGSTIYEELKPGWTNYLKKVQYSTHDVTDMCQEGYNTFGALVTSGWLTGRIAKNAYASKSLGYLCFIGKLVITYTDGTKQVFVSDETWRTWPFGPVMSSGIYEGEYYDARVPMPWDKDASIRSFAALTFDYKYDILPMQSQIVTTLEPMAATHATIFDTTNTGEMNIVSEHSRPSSINLKRGQTAVYDFGQNMAAVPRFVVKGANGTRIHMRMAEILNDSGLSSRYNDGPQGTIFTTNLRQPSVGNLYYVLKGDESSEEYRPTTTYYGYRYVQVTATDDIEIIAFEALPITSSHVDIGMVETDNELVNNLFESIRWGQRSNIQTVPTDCPSRDERLGWTGDAMIFARTAMYNGDVSSVLNKWLGDMIDSQRADGAYSDVAPDVLGYYGSSAWADAGIVVTWNVYLMTGKKEIIEENYYSMSRYMDFLASCKSNGIEHPGGVPKYGDWLSIATTDPQFISQAYYAYDAQLMAKMAKAIGRSDDEDKYSDLFRAIRDEMQQMYFNADGLDKPTQTACAMALYFGLCKDEAQKECVANTLSQLIVDNGNRLDTGFLGTAYLNLALTETGHSDLAYNLLLQRQYPSWLYMLDHGGTTMWEYWYSYTDEKGIFKYKINSFNHYAYGAVAEWMYSHMAGILPSEEAPGFKKIIFAPHPDLRHSVPNGQDRIRYARSEYMSQYGKILAEWNLDEKEALTYHIIVPANTTAEVRMPIESGIKVVNVPSGEYTFRNEEDGINVIEQSPKNLRVWPNPVEDVMHIDTNGEIASVLIYNAVGAKVGSWSDSNNCIDLSALSSGLYIVKAVIDNTTYTTKIIKR